MYILYLSLLFQFSYIPNFLVSFWESIFLIYLMINLRSLVPATVSLVQVV